LGRVRAYVGLGANIGSPAVGNGASIGDPDDTIAAAVHALAALPGVRLVGVSRLYATAPVGVTDQPEFRNAVAALDVRGGANPVVEGLALLVAFKGLERALGRRDGPRWGPRALDLDLLVFGRHAIHAERPSDARSAHPDRAAAQWLTVPHASARDRLFVLAPLADLAPGLRPPGWGETVATARRRADLREGPMAARPVAEWDRATGAWTPESPGVAADGSLGRSAGPASGGSGGGP
jgi:2-amino-4-hydroxy-6-hydroxymethyldihydropteridine diphosphokinase